VSARAGCAIGRWHGVGMGRAGPVPPSARESAWIAGGGGRAVHTQQAVEEACGALSRGLQGIERTIWGSRERFRLGVGEAVDTRGAWVG